MHTIQTLLLSAMFASAGLCQAHGDADHATKRAALKKEQKDWGIAGDAKGARRTIEVTMLDAMRFTPDRVVVKRGETVRFVVRNDGRQLHEFVIGTKKENDEHAALMVKFPGMQHDEPYMAHVPPGQTGEIVWTFNRVGEFDFACLKKKKKKKSMRGKLIVAAK